MIRPTDNEIAAALAEAQRMRAAGEDPHGLAKALLYLQHRGSYLAAVREATEHFLHSGQAEHEHALLVRALGRALAEEGREGGADPDDLGLG